MRGNATLTANQTIQARVTHALRTADQAADQAIVSSDTQAQLTPTLLPLLENASAVRLLGDQTVALIAVWVANANRLNNESRALLGQTQAPNPDRSQVSFFRFSLLLPLGRHIWGSNSRVQKLHKTSTDTMACKTVVERRVFQYVVAKSVLLPHPLPTPSKPYCSNHRHLSLILRGGWGGCVTRTPT